MSRYTTCNFTKISTPPWVFFTFFKLYKWYQIAQRTTYLPRHISQNIWDNTHIAILFLVVLRTIDLKREFDNSSFPRNFVKLFRATLFRTVQPEVFNKTAALKHLVKFTEKYSYHSLFLNKVAD